MNTPFPRGIDALMDFATAATPAEDCTPAAAKVLSGLPVQQVRNHYSSPCGQFHCGIWEAQPGHWTVAYGEHEYCEILAGRSRLVDGDGAARIVQAGDRFVIPAGFRGSWEVLEPCRKVYVIFEPKA